MARSDATRRFHRRPVSVSSLLSRIGTDATADALEAQRDSLDPIARKAWIDRKLTQIWKLDSALIAADSAVEFDLEGWRCRFMGRDSELEPLPVRSGLSQIAAV